MNLRSVLSGIFRGSVPRQVSSVERHVRLGAELASGTPLAAASTPHEGAIEGVTTALAFAGWVGPPRPPRASLVTAVARVLRGEQAALAAIEGLLATDLDDPIMPRVRAEARG
jgi:glycerol-3-phosphate dehydrogenase